MMKPDYVLDQLTNDHDWGKISYNSKGRPIQICGRCKSKRDLGHPFYPHNDDLSSLISHIHTTKTPLIVPQAKIGKVGKKTSWEVVHYG